MPIELLTPQSPLVDRLLASCEFRRALVSGGNRLPNAADALLASAQHVANLLNLLFWASLHSEESRTVGGTVCICSPQEAPRSRRLSRSVPVTAKSLVQLFVASPLNSLAIHLEDDTPCVWGLLDSLPMFTLRLRVEPGGSLIVSENTTVIAVLERGDTLIPDPVSRMDWTSLIANTLGTTPFPQRLALASRIQSVAVAVHRHGHGGALVIVPPAAEGTDLPDIALAYRFAPERSNTIQALLAELEQLDVQLLEAESQRLESGHLAPLQPLLESSIEAHRELLNKMLESTGNLSRIDGAVVMDTDLRVHGFGAKLSGSQDDFSVTTIDALTKLVDRVSVSALGGMRHQSAARYIQRNMDSLVIVASQDGRVTLFVWATNPGEVVAVRHLEHHAGGAVSAA